MTDRGWQIARTDEIPRLGKTWIPIRKHFGIRAFGVNAWVADAEGEDVIGEHVEESGHDAPAHTGHGGHLDRHRPRP